MVVRGISTVRGVIQAAVDFLGEQHHLAAGQQLSFGRAADIEIDDNPFMHRIVGRIWFDGGRWTISNEGSRTELLVVDAGTGARTTVPPGQRASLPEGSWRIAFTAGPTTYELSGTTSSAATPVKGAVVVGDDTHTTAQFAWVELTDGQRLVLVALCQDYLRGDLRPGIPPDKAIAQSLGLTTKAVQRRIDALASKYSAAGVSGLAPEAGAGDQRRIRLVAHALETRVVGVEDLALLPC